ncbi:uncharacterized protein LOC129569380 [Sitodiplosis mosellana]|uniref:uncharacterized protein LOC129569380 n=1 Tax=Sitodiplosis mosellana TaxID=263140 RepID=UPI002444A46A|nr:uncharacterized protein LOC129569380 [Sitodiplosis mosellana]
MSDQPKDLRKLCILNAKESDDDDKIRSLCETFGRVIHFNRPPSKRALAFPLYQNESDAQRAKDGLSAEGYRVQFANAKRGDNSSEDTGHQKRSEFRSRQNLAENGSENGFEADSSSDNRPYGVCIKCGDKAYYNCGRCREFYCSEECQESDWLTHKPNCVSMPKLVPAKSTYSIRASRYNLSDSVEKLPEANHVVKGTDAADGRPNGESLPIKVEPKVEPLPQKAESIASASKKVPISSTASDTVSNSDDKRSKAGTLIEENRNTEKVTRSPRARLLAQTKAEPVPAQATPAQPTNGLVSDSIPDNTEVYITHVRTHRSVYIRSALTNDEYAKLITEVGETSKTQPKLTVHPNRNDIVMAPFDGMYYRAIVISCDKANAMVKVGFIDFGNSDEVPFSHIKALPKHLQTHRRLIIPVALKGIHDDYETNEKDNMSKHLGELCDSGVGLRVKGDNPHINGKESVELFDLITNQSVSEVLNATVQKRYRIEDIKQKVVKNASDVEIMIIGPERICENYVTCILKTDVDTFMNADNLTQAFGMSVKNAPAYKPKVKELCVVEIKEPEGKIWYRCQYQQELVDDHAQVYCFDYGRIERVRANNIRSITEDVAFEITSFVGLLENGDKMSVEEKNVIIQDPAVKAASIKYDGDLHRITLA